MRGGGIVRGFMKQHRSNLLPEAVNVWGGGGGASLKKKGQAGGS